MNVFIILSILIIVIGALLIVATPSVLFKGLNSLHRVTPTIGNRTRILVVLAYNNKAGVSLSETARMTFFGRLS